MGIISSGSGDEMLLFRPGCEPPTLDDYPDLPLVFACVIARRGDKVLYIYSAYRNEWELPAGLLEEGETPLQGAMRELKEESGQTASAFECVGLCLIRLGRSGRLELGTIFTAELDPLQPFVTDGETTAMMLWDGMQPVEGHLDEISLEACRLLDS
jgi:8-oxo-dGTP diphosphatase